MRVELVCVALATLAASFPSLSDGVPLNVLSAPNVLRVGSKENVFVEVQDGSGGPMQVTVMVKDHPSKSKKLFETTIQLDGNSNYQKLVEIFIPEANYINLDSRQKEYVYLQAQFPNNQLLEKVVLVSFQSGYIFIQTDKPLYTPGSMVYYRALVVTPGLEPLIKDVKDMKDISISIDFVTTDNITIHRSTVTPDMGMKSGNYKLPEIVSPGVWKVLGRFQNTPQRTFTAEFEVKEYVLPSFEIKIEPRKAFFYVDDQDLHADISARYLFGKEVNGVAYVMFGVFKDGSRKNFPSSLQRVEIRNGKGEAMLKREDILQTFQKINDLISHPLFISVKVLTDSGGEMVEAERGGIKVVTSPYTIHFKHTPQYFKLGMPFNIKVYVTNPDNSPAAGLKLEISPNAGFTQTNDDGIATAKVNTAGSTMTVTVKTNDPDIDQDKQASRSLQVAAYQSPSKNLLHLSVSTNDNNLELTMNTAGGVSNMDITILILSRGQLVKSDRKKMVGTVLSVNLPITKDMLPSFRVVAYYHVGSNEVVSDSVWVEVKTSCMGTLKVEATRPAPSYQPRENFELKITGDPGAKVGLVAVDKGVIVLNNKHRLTQKKVWDVVEKYDTGCTAGSGKDGMGVFYDAGLLLQTNTGIGTNIRTEPSCPVSTRRKRAVTIFQVRNKLESKYSNKLERECCVAGMRENTLDYSCKRRSDFVSDGTACVNAFIYCCEQMKEEKKKHTHGELDLARSAEDDASYLRPDEITSRTQFPESWLWTEKTLPNCPDGKKCKTTSMPLISTMQDSITTWQITAISLSKDNGVCVTEPYEMIVLKDFFIDLRLPYSAVYNEQLEIKAVLHNYRLSPIKVRIYLMENENICSSANKKKSYHQDVTVQASFTLIVPYVMIPLKLGEQFIEVKASIYETGIQDGIKKKLRVVPPGELIKKVFTVELDPSTKPGGEQKEQIKSGVPQNQMPNTPASTEISVTGGSQTNVMVESVINGNSMGSLIVQPVGCGEQNMIYMTLPVITTVYLDTTRQWETIGLEKRATALGFIKTGYQRELAYGKGDGSFSAWKERPSSTWLTAYVTKVFAMASPLIPVETDVVCNAVKWLILNAQLPDGKFVEKAPVIHGEMIGDVAGLDTETSMTAFVLIALQEARSLCDVKVNGMRGSMDKATDYIKQRLPSVTNPYAVAMASYAMANENKLDMGQLLKFSTGLNHWEVPRGNTVFTLEATAYALLALVKANALTEAGSVVKWLGMQRKVGGGYGSTQATIMVYQSVAKYWSQASTVKEFDLDVNIKIAGRNKPEKYKFNRGNQFVTRTTKVKDVNQDLTVEAKGVGQATLSVVTLYYAVLDKSNPGCTEFELSVDMVQQGKVSYPGAHATYLLKISIRYKSKERDATMSVLDIGLLTGFIADFGDLGKLQDGKDRYIERFEPDKLLSERGSLIIYLNKVSHKETDHVNFRIHSVNKVGVLQPAAVSVYEYYQRTHCRVFYHPQRDDGGLLTLGDKEDEGIRRCAEENCSMQKKLGLPDSARSDKACEVTKEQSVDYVYKATVKAMVKEQATDQYSMTIEEVLKEGTDKDVKGKLRQFIAFALCRESLGLAVGKTYLLMGITRDVYKPREGSNVDYQYVLGEQTWVEYWPTDAECQTTEVYRPACLGLDELVGQLGFFGCPQK